VTFLNAVAAALTGWPAAEALGKDITEVFPIVTEGSRRAVENPVVKALRAGTVVGLANQTLLRARDGVERPIDDSGAPIRDRQGRLVGAVLVFRDITARRQAEDAQRHLAALVASSEDAIIGKTLDGIITSWNQGAERLYGYTAAEMVGQSIARLTPPDLPDELPAMLVRLLGRDGHTVDTATNGRLALAQLAERAHDLILSDVRMPELDGPSLYRLLERQQPHLCQRFIFLTGDMLEPATQIFLAASGVPCLTKPLRSAEVRRAIQEFQGQVPDH
jgi:PAS domain S-box-containing protein